MAQKAGKAVPVVVVAGTLAVASQMHGWVSLKPAAAAEQGVRAHPAAVVPPAHLTDRTYAVRTGDNQSGMAQRHNANRSKTHEPGPVHVGQVVSVPPDPPASPAAHRTHVHRSRSQGSGSSRTWVLAGSSMANVARADATVAQSAFSNPGTYLTSTYSNSHSPVPAGWASVATVNFKAFTGSTGFAAIVAEGKMPAWTQAVLYDPEAWSQTPVSEQTNACSYMQRVVNLAKSHGWRVILTPGTDLGNAVSHPGQTNQQWFISANIAGCAAATGAQVVEVQAQANEFDATNSASCAGNTDKASYQSYVCHAAAEAKAAQPGVTFISGLTANRSGQHATGAQLYAAAETVPSYAAGFFLNCDRPAQDAAASVTLLQDLGY